MAIKDRLATMPVIGTGLAVQERTKRDAADQFAAAVAFFGFVSLFPLMAIAVSITAVVLADQPDRIGQVIDAIQTAIPGVGATGALEDSIDEIQDNAGGIGLVGGVLLVFTGLRVTKALQTATRFVFDLPLAHANPVVLRLWQLASLVVLGLLLVVGVGASSVATSLLRSGFGEQLGPVVGWLSHVVAAALDILLFWVAYRIYSLGSELGWRRLLPGAVFGGIGWAILKVVGGEYAARQGGNTGAVVAGVIGLLFVFYLAGRFYVYGAELSAELAGVGDDGRVDKSLPHDGSVHQDDGGSADERRAGGAADEGPATVPPDPDRHTAGSPRTTLGDRFRERGQVADDPSGPATTPGSGSSGTAGRELVPWQASRTSPLQDRRTRQAAAFASSALAVLTAGLLGRRR